jgi:integrase
MRTNPNEPCNRALGVLLRIARFRDRRAAYETRPAGRDQASHSIPKELAKGRRARRVPLWWDAGTLADIADWAAERTRQGAKPDDPFVCSAQANRNGAALKRHALRRRFRTACKALGPQRVYDLTIHHGRHTFISHALAGGRTLAEVRDAAGHSDVSITSAYLHVAVDDDGALGNLFKFD